MKLIKHAFIVSLIIFTLILGACTQSPSQPPVPTDNASITDVAPISFIENKRSRSEECIRTYTEYIAKTGYADFSIEKALYDEVDAEVIVKSIDKALLDICAYFDTEIERPTIMLVTQDNIYGKVLKQSFSHETTLYTSIDNVESGEYVSALIGMLTDVSDAWAQYGIAAQICSTAPESDALSQYYNSGGDINIVGLAPSRLFEPLAGEETGMAEKTAICFYDYIVKSHSKEEALRLALSGFEGFDIGNEKQAWLKSINVTVPYEYEYEGAFTGYTFERSSTHDVMISSPYATYLIKISKNDDKLLLNTCEGFERFLYKNQMGIKAYWELMDKSELKSQLISVPPIYDIIEEPVQIPSSDITGYVTDMTANPPYIRLHEQRIEYAHMHEYIHATLPYCPDVIDTRAHIWLGEGLATALSTALPIEYAHEISIAGGIDDFYEYITYDLSLCDDQALKLLLSTMQSYYSSKRNANLPYDRKLCADALAVGMLTAYPQALNEGHPYLFESWMAYMIKTYSLDNALKAYLDTDNFESIYDMTFEEAVGKWKEAIGFDLETVPHFV